MSYMYDVSNATYRDAGCPSQCSAMYEYSTVAEMNGVNGALPIPPTSQLRLYQTPSVVNAQNQVVNPPPTAQGAIDAGAPLGAGIPQAAPTPAQYIRRRF